MLGPTADAVAVAPLRLQRVSGLPEGTESTAEVSADGAELLKVAVDGTRPQVATLLAELRPDSLLFDFVTPWVTGLATLLGIDYLATQHGKPVLVMGPVVPELPQGELKERWAKWLSSFRDNAIVFGSFGSDRATPRPGVHQPVVPRVLNFLKGTTTTAERQLRLEGGTVEGSLWQKASRQMLQASCTPPSTKRGSGRGGRRRWLARGRG
ncbi:hypothetical protein ZWY2020_021307 [Hordeum vulgare]|nr:hypothetical protein ZWY2020_021307 [Hordeum vulgare]